MTTVDIYNILKQIKADAMVNMALYLSEDFSRLSTPIDQILDLSKDYEYKCTKSPKFCLGFAYAYGYRNLYKNVMEHPYEDTNYKPETYLDYDRQIMDDCFREYIRRRTILIQVKQFADQEPTKEVHQKCYEILYDELKKELQLVIENFSCEGKDNILMLVRRLKLFVEMELPIQITASVEPIPQEYSNELEKDSQLSALKPIVPSEKWNTIETIHEELGLHIDTCSNATTWIRKMQKEGKIEVEVRNRELYETFEKVYGPLNYNLEAFRKGLERK